MFLAEIASRPRKSSPLAKQSMSGDSSGSSADDHHHQGQRKSTKYQKESHRRSPGMSDARSQLVTENRL